MDSFDIAAFVVMGILAAFAITLFVFLGLWPGKVAHRLQHPYRKAITVGSWIMLPLGGIGWAAMLIWAYAISDPQDNEQLNESMKEK